MKKIRLIISSIFLIIAIISCSNHLENVRVLKAKEFVSQYENDLDGLLLDVRTEDEFNNGYIEGALNFDVNNASFKDNVKHIDKSKHIYIYCRSGKRSQKAAKILTQLGFKTIYDLNGGYISYLAKTN